MDGSSSVLKSGEVSLQVKAFMKSSWVKKFCVLHRKTEESHPYLEFHENRKAFDENKLNNGKGDVKRIELQQVKYIRSSAQKTSKGCEYQIELKCKNQKHFLMFDKENDSSVWYKYLNSTADIAEHGDEGSSSISNDRERSDSDDDDDDDDEVVTLNQMYASTEQAQRFTVEVEDTPLAKLCSINGHMTMLVGLQEIAFEKTDSKQIKYTFQLAWMRRFGKKHASQFYFECGRKCPNGEGTVKCNTESAKEIHRVITAKSSSRSKTVIPHKSEKDASPEPSKKVVAPAITGPSFVTNIPRRHPGSKVPALIPIAVDRTETEDDSSMPTSPTRNSSGRNFGSQKDKNENDKGSVGKKKSSNIAKELNEMLHPVEDNGIAGGIKKKDESKNRNSKDEKKREKEEKKERERREKEEKKERERKEKEEKREKDRKEKEDKKKSKKKDENENTPKLPTSSTSSFKQKNSIYDEPEIEYDDERPQGSNEALYDEATSPVSKQKPDIVEYAEPYQVKKSLRKPESQFYDEASSVSRDSSRKSAPQPAQQVEYAQPYVKKGGRVPDASVTSEPVTYTDVKTIEQNAWRRHGREEEEEVFEEDYSNIKSVRSQLKDAPPVPERGYSETETNEEVDDTYNRIDLMHGRARPKVPPKTENLYGTASGKAVGPIQSNVPVRMGDDSDSEGEEEEDFYAVAEFEGYEETSIRSSVKSKPVIEAYEEAVPVQRPSVKPKVVAQIREPLYEEVG